MLLQAFVLFNEYISLLDPKKLGSIEDPNAHHPHELMAPNKVPETEQQNLDQVAPVRVGAAMLYEPLRIYTEVVKEIPELRDDGVEDLAGLEFRQSALRDQRRIVFHVATNNIDPDEVDSRVVRQVLEFSPQLLLERLAAFYWRWPQ